MNVQRALKAFDIDNLSRLKIDLPAIYLKNSKEFLQLSDYLEKYESWALRLEKICEEGNVENLEEMYKETKEISVGYEQKLIIKRSLVGIYSWKERVKIFLNEGGELNEGKALAKEGEYVCFECEEQENLSVILEKLKVVRKKAAKIINSLPNTYPRLPLPSRVYKKRHLLEEYMLDSTGDTVNDMVSTLENAIEIIAPMESTCFPLYHPTQGLSVILCTPSSYKSQRIPEEKKKRTVTYKQINEDVKNIKRPPRRPKGFEISRQTYCVCKNEAS